LSTNTEELNRNFFRIVCKRYELFIEVVTKVQWIAPKWLY